MVNLQVKLPVMRMIILVIGIVLIIGTFRQLYAYYLALRLIKNGIDAEAMILGIQEMGMTIDRQPRVLLQLQVKPVVGKNFVIELKHVRTGGDNQLLPGNKLKVRYNPNNHRQVKITITPTGVVNPVGVR